MYVLYDFWLKVLTLLFLSVKKKNNISNVNFKDLLLLLVSWHAWLFCDRICTVRPLLSDACSILLSYLVCLLFLLCSFGLIGLFP